MEIRHTRSATKHRVSRQRSAYVIEHNAIEVEQEAGARQESPHYLYLGADADGVLLEVAALKQDDGTLLVIHAMPIRAKNRRLLEGDDG